MSADDTTQSTVRSVDDAGPTEAWEAARRAAEAAGLSLSVWVSQAIREASTEAAEHAAAKAAQAAGMSLPDWLSQVIKESSVAERRADAARGSSHGKVK